MKNLLSFFGNMINKGQMNTEWKHIVTIAVEVPFKIKGLNIWDFTWRDTGQKIKVVDPLYGQNYTFTIWEINKNDKTVTFAAGEFSNCIWGFYNKSKNY